MCPRAHQNARHLEKHPANLISVIARPSWVHSTGVSCQALCFVLLAERSEQLSLQSSRAQGPRLHLNATGQQHVRTAGAT